MGHHQIRIFREHADHGEVVDRPVRQRLVGRGRKRVSRWNGEQRVAIRRGARDLERRGRAGRTRLALDHHPLAQAPRQAVGDDPGNQIGGSAGGKPCTIVMGRSGQSGLERAAASDERPKPAGNRNASRELASLRPPPILCLVTRRSKCRARACSHLLFGRRLVGRNPDSRSPCLSLFPVCSLAPVAALHNPRRANTLS